METMPLARTNLAREAAQVLRQAIFAGRFLPGERLKQDALATMLGVSRTTVRYALAQLEQEGLVSDVGAQGIAVTRPEDDEAIDLYDVRELFDGLAARLAARRATTSQMEALRAIVREMETAAGAGEMYNWFEINRRFHEAVVEAAQSALLLRLLPGIQLALRRFGPLLLSLSAPAVLKTSWQEHIAICDAIEQRDEARAELLSRRHTSQARDRVQERLRQGGVGPTAAAVDRPELPLPH